MKKFILKLELHDDKDKRRALKAVSTLSGIDSITMNMKERTLTVVGTVDPINVVSKLRKFWSANILSVGPAKEPEKKEESKKEDGKKDEAKKEDGKKEEGSKEEPKKKEEGKEEEKKKALPNPVAGMFMPPYRPYYPPLNPNTYYNNYQPYQLNYHPQLPQHHAYQPRHHSIEENPNACLIS